MIPSRGKRPFTALFLSLLLILILLPVRRAKAVSFDTMSFRPAPDASYYMSLFGSRTLTTLNWTTGFYLDYSRDPLVLIRGGAFAGNVVHQLLAGRFFGGIGVTEWADVGLIAGVALFEDFVDPVTRVQSKSIQFGDLRLHGKLRMVNVDLYPVGVSFVPYLDIPTGSGTRFVGNDTIAGGGHFVVDTKRFQNRVSFASDLGFFGRQSVTLAGGTVVGSMLTYGVGSNVMLVPPLDLLLEIVGGTVTSRLFKSAAESPLELRAGLRYYFGKDRRFRATLAGGGGVIAGIGSPRTRVIAGLAYTPPFIYREVTLGEPTVREAYEVYELVDKCPVEVGGYVVGRDDPRCTEVYELQSISEACPEAGEFNPEVDNPKCLQVYLLRAKDSDRDGVPDFRDRCPTERGDADAEGCPTDARVIIRLDEGIILTQVIHFNYSESTLRSDAFPILESLADTIRAQPGIQKISIDGHTDKKGTAEFNLKLSQDRAKRVYDYLVRAGVNPQRLEWRGLGYDVPVADNRIDEGRAKNRRVEFLIKKITPGIGEALEMILGKPKRREYVPETQPEPEALPEETVEETVPETAPETAPESPPETQP